MSEFDFRHDPATTAFGGAAIFTGPDVKIVTDREDLTLKHTDNNDKNYLVESTWVETNIKGIEGNVIIGCVYRHPKGNVDIFTEDFDRIMQAISNEGKICFVCGDLNINLINRIHNPTTHFLNTILTQNFIPHITLPTRITESTATVIDNILVKYNKSITENEIVSGNLFCDISDHLPNFILFGKDKPKQNRPYIRIFSDKNIQKFREYLKSTDWQLLIQEENCNDAYNIMLNIIKVGYDKHFRWVKLSKKRSKDKHWITLGLKVSSNTKNKMYRLYRKKPTTQKLEKYKKYKNMFIKLCEQAEVEHFHQLLNDIKASLKALWETFGPVMNPSK